jgi:hypothetical protein
MIILDEHLTDPRLATAIARWYQGQVIYITMLRPGTHVKDDVIPTLLQQAKQPTFVTINWTDFWRQTSANKRYSIICFTLILKHVDKIPKLLRRVLKLEPFQTKASRMGKVVRVTKDLVQYYQVNDPHIYTVNFI